MASHGGTTVDHDEIRQWAEARGAKPSRVIRTGNEDPEVDPGIIRLDFPGYTGAGALEEITWDEWFQAFEDGELAFIHQDETKDGEQSNFNRLVKRATVEARLAGDSHANAQTTGTSRRGAGKTGRKSAAKGARKSPVKRAAKGAAKSAAKSAAKGARKSATKSAGTSARKGAGKTASKAGARKTAAKSAAKRATAKKAAGRKTAAKAGARKSATKSPVAKRAAKAPARKAAGRSTAKRPAAKQGRRR